MTVHVPSRAAFLMRLAALTLAYFLAGRLGLSMAYLNASASPIWPPTGIAVAALLLFGRQLWPGVAAGALLVNLSTSGSISAAALIALGNTLEALLAAYLVERFAHGAQAFERTRDVFLFVVAAAVIAPIVSATIGVSALALSHLAEPGAYRTVWLTWWMGDALGSVLYAPALILLWIDRRPRTRLEQIEGLIVIVALIVLAAAVFRYGGEPERGSYPLGFLCIPLALWPAFRVGQRETAIAAVALSIVAVWGTLGRYGPYATELPNRGLLLAQTFAGVVAITTAAMAALVGERQRLHDQLERRVSQRTDQLKLTNEELHVEIAARERVQGALRSSESRLLEAQALAHVGSWEWDVEADHLRWSDEVYRILRRGAGPLRSHVSNLPRNGPPRRSGRLEEAVRDALSTGGLFEVEHRIVRPDGTERTVAGRGRTVCDADGRPILMLGTELDITDRARGEEQRRELAEALSARRQAEAASRMKDEFLAIGVARAAHPAQRHPRLVRMLGADRSSRRDAKALEIIERNAVMQARLIEDLLDVSRIATGQAVVEPLRSRSAHRRHRGRGDRAVGGRASG